MLLHSRTGLKHPFIYSLLSYQLAVHQRLHSLGFIHAVIGTVFSLSLSIRNLFDILRNRYFRRITTQRGRVRRAEGDGFAFGSEKTIRVRT